MSAALPLLDGGHALVDEVDLSRLLRIVWRKQPIKRASGGFYVYGRCPVTKKKVYLHRFILGAKRGQQVDHANGNGLDNRRVNIRICDQSLNNANRTDIPNRHGYRGVYWCGSSMQFRGKVCLNHRTIQTRRFKTAEEAAKARDLLALKIQREFAVLNFGPTQHAEVPAS